MDPVTLGLGLIAFAGSALFARVTSGPQSADGTPAGEPKPPKNQDALWKAATTAAAYVCLADTLRFQAARKIGVPFISLVPKQWDTYDCNRKLLVYSYIMVELGYYAVAAILLSIANPAMLSQSWKLIRATAHDVLKGASSAPSRIAAFIGKQLGGAADAVTKSNTSESVSATTSGGNVNVNVGGIPVVSVHW